jgi:HAD superfamily hydrolase (TIGR01484 family)
MFDFNGILIATDLDGTFVSSKGALVERNIEAIERFKAGGGLFTFATGRVIWSMAGLVPTYREIVNAPMVLCNGATLYNPRSQRDIYADLLDTFDTLAALEFIRREFPETRRFIYVGDGYTQTEDTSDTDFREHVTSGWHKMLVGCPEGRIDELQREVTSCFPDKFAYSRSCPTLFELLPPGSTKGKMLKRLKEYYAGRGQALTVYAVGDYDNDTDMLRSADVACCPDNALDSVKALCDIKLGHCDGGAIADLIELIESGKA